MRKRLILAGGLLCMSVLGGATAWAQTGPAQYLPAILLLLLEGNSPTNAAPTVALTSPANNTALTSQPRLYFPGAGGTVYFRDQPDASSGTAGQIAFYGLSNYQANPQAYDASVIINTPLMSDSAGNIYFGFLMTGNTPLALTSGIARISASGRGPGFP